MPGADELTGSVAAARSAADRRGPGKEPHLLPTPELEWAEFEDFTERLLSALRWCPAPVVRVVEVRRWGRRGEKQDGIDFAGTLSDGRRASWQCKRQDRLTPADIRAAVSACTYEADIHHLVYSGEASQRAQAEMDRHPGWVLVDRRALGRLVDDLPVHRQRDLLDTTWGRARRRQLLPISATDAFLSLEAFDSGRRDHRTVLNDLATHVGRERELSELGARLARGSEVPVVIISGPGGRGKTRLLLEALRHAEAQRPTVPVLVLAPGHRVDAAALGELPLTPAVVVVDDAHQDPGALVGLLRYAQEIDGTQLVLTTRPSGLHAVRRQVALASMPLPAEDIDVGPLTRPQARALVDALTEGLDLRPGARRYLAGQATNSPHVAVIAANLIRRGDLVAPVVVDDQLREQVMARYEELSAPTVQGISGADVRRFLAVYAALGPVEDASVAGDVEAFCGLTTRQRLELLEHLRDAGVLHSRDGRSRVVPDVLADDFLERESAVGAHDTGFVGELWEAFGPAHRDRLLPALGELDWRLTRRAGPSILAGVWTQYRQLLLSESYVVVHAELGRARDLAMTQPVALMELLDALGRRLHNDDLRSGPPPAPSSTTADPDPRRGALAALLREAAGRTSSADVRRRMPELYVTCAANSPALLERALEAIWGLRSGDDRQVTGRRGPVAELISSRLVNLGDLPDASFPERVIRWVRTMAARANDDERVPLLDVLATLLAKEGEHHVAESPRVISFRPFAIAVAWASPLRALIREVLLEGATPGHLGPAGAAVRLLGKALAEPHGAFGRPVPTAEVVGWEDDDLETVAALRSIAETGASPALRRLVRENVSWAAQYATSLRLRHAALTLVTELDRLESDDLVEVVLHPRGEGLPSRRGTQAPSFEQVAGSADRAGDSGEEDSGDVRYARTAEEVRVRGEQQAALLSQALTVLVDTAGAEGVRTAVQDACREIRGADPQRHFSLWGVWHELGRLAPGTIAPLVEQIAGGPAGPLDADLHLLLEQWARADVAALLAWLQGFERLRPAVRHAVGAALEAFDWTDRGPAMAEVLGRGSRDPEAHVRDRFLAGGHRMLAADPEAGVAFLLDGDITPPAAARVLERTYSLDEAKAAGALTREHARAVLRLVERAGVREYGVQELVAILARQHPDLVLDWLRAMERLPAEIVGLGSALEERADAYASWLVERARSEDLRATPVVRLVSGSGLTRTQADLLTERSAALDGDALIALAELLRDVHTWPLSHPDLARRLLEEARALDPDTAEAVRVAVRRGMALTTWTSVDGVSSELDAARADASRCASSEIDPELRADFERQRALIEATIADLAREGEEDDEG